MKKEIHPKYIEATVTCNGCNTTFKTRSTTQEIMVEICSNCHPFYTGKQKLVDVAGRVDRFKAQQTAASKQTKKPKVQKRKAPADIQVDANESLKELKKELEAHTVDAKQ